MNANTNESEKLGDREALDEIIDIVDNSYLSPEGRYHQIVDIIERWEGRS
jgi:hypothetical protein